MWKLNRGRVLKQRKRHKYVIFLEETEGMMSDCISSDEWTCHQEYYLYYLMSGNLNVYPDSWKDQIH